MCVPLKWGGKRKSYSRSRSRYLRVGNRQNTIMGGPHDPEGKECGGAKRNRKAKVETGREVKRTDEQVDKQSFEGWIAKRCGKGGKAIHSRQRKGEKIAKNGGNLLQTLGKNIIWVTTQGVPKVKTNSKGETGREGGGLRLNLWRRRWQYCTEENIKARWRESESNTRNDEFCLGAQIRTGKNGK